jgi:hypothetical protein
MTGVTVERGLAAFRQLHDAGELKPWRITQALNAGGHYGPEVDVACGVTEPAVDQWEAGELYPTWVQVLRLARLTDVMPGFFYKDGPDHAGGVVFLCDRQHPSRSEVHVIPPRLDAYTLDVIRATVGED